MLLSVDGDVELDRAVGTAEFLREIKLALRGGRLLGIVEELDALGRGRAAGGICEAAESASVDVVMLASFCARSRLPVGPVL